MPDVLRRVGDLDDGAFHLGTASGKPDPTLKIKAETVENFRDLGLNYLFDGAGHGDIRYRSVEHSESSSRVQSARMI